MQRLVFPLASVVAGSWILACGVLDAAPTIRQKKWIVLGPIQNAGDCWGEIGDPNPTPGHDLLSECPAAGDDWGGTGIPFVAGAPSTWHDLSRDAAGQGAPEFQCLCWDLIFRRDQGLVLAIDRMKAVAVTYIVNQTGAPAEIQVCSGTSNESQRVWIDRELIADFRSCSGEGAGRSCPSLVPALLPPGKCKLTVVSYNGGSGWSSGIRLLRMDGTVIDDESDPDFVITPDPNGCEPDRPRVERFLSARCAEDEATVTLRGNGAGDPAELVQVVERIEGPVEVSNISHGGTLTPGSAPFACSQAEDLGGVFTSAMDIGAPCFHGSSAQEGDSYLVAGGGADIWNEVDQFQFAFAVLGGDFSLSARIADRPSDGEGEPNVPSRWGKFGLMARQGCAPLSRYTAIFDVTESSDGTDPDSYGLQGRTVHGSPVTSFGSPGFAGGIQHPNYLRLDREGSRFTGYGSMDGVLWVRVAEHDWGDDAPCEVAVGLAVTSHAGCDRITVQFDEIEVAGGATPCGGDIRWDVERTALNAGLTYTIEARESALTSTARFHGIHPSGVTGGPRTIALGAGRTGGPHLNWTIDVGRTSPAFLAGTTAYSEATGVYTLVSSGDDIGDGGDRFHFAFSEVAGDFDFAVEILERTEPPEGAFPWGELGLMLRKDCSGTSKHAHLQTPSGERTRVVPGLAYRPIHGAGASTVDLDQTNAMKFDYGDVGQRPRFMRLQRLRSTVYASFSRDGAVWEPIGADTWHEEDPEAPVLVGFAASSGRGFDGVVRPTTVRFRVMELEPLLAPALLVQESDARERFLESDFSTLPAEDWAIQSREPSYMPRVNPATERLEILSEGTCCLATSVFSRRALSDVDGSIWEFQFDAYLTNLADEAGDGFTFTLIGGTDPTRVGYAGGALGYEGLGDNTNPANGFPGRNVLRNSFSVGFDAFSGTTELNGGLGAPQSPGRWHLQIDTGGQTLNSVAHASELPDIFDARGVHCRILYNRGLVQVWVHGNDGSAPPEVPAVAARVAPITMDSPDTSAVFGFTGGTYGARVVAEVDDLRVTRLPARPRAATAALAADVPPELRPGALLSLDGRGSMAAAGDLSYVWRVLSGPAEVEGPSDGSTAQVRVTGAGAPIVVALTVADEAGSAPALPPLDELDLCTPECPLPGYCVTCLDPPWEGTCIAVICPPSLPAEVPGPQEIEATLAEGTARFAWHNPVSYDAIRVEDLSGNLIEELPGRSAFLELPALSHSEVAVVLRGVDIVGSISDPGIGIARVLQCVRPPPLTPVGEKGDLELTLYGGQSVAEPERCVPFPVGGVGGGSGASAAVGHGGGVAAALRDLGFVRTELVLSDLQALTTGFTLEEYAEKLEIAVWYRKIFNGPGVELRARLHRVGPDLERNFTDVFTWPDVFVSALPERRSIVYFRADGDLGKGGAEECHQLIPAGDYLLDFFAVGGERKTAYFGFPDDKRDTELFVPGAPCPPYPLAEVTDLSGFPTLPNLNGIVAEPRPRVGCVLPALGVTFTAEVSPSRMDPDLNYSWTIHDRGGQPQVKSSGSSTSLSTCVSDWGCYLVELAVRSKSCPDLEKKAQFEVAVIPTGVACDPASPRFTAPMPDPSGIYAVVGLTTPAATARGRFEPRGNLEFRVLGVPPCPPNECGDVDDCPSLSLDERAPEHLQVEFRLAARVLATLPPSGLADPIDPDGPGPRQPVEDLCINRSFGPKYFKVTFQDPGTLLDFFSGGAPPRFKAVWLQARVKSSSAWQNVGAAMHFTNHPPVLEASLWSGHYDEKEGAYKFLIKMAEGFEAGKPIGPTSPIPIPVPGHTITIPSYENEVTSGFTSRFEMARSQWDAVPAAGNLSGKVLSNEISGAQSLVDGVESALGTYTWCKDIPIFNRALEQKLFEAILFTGTVGPIPVTVWASIALGLQFNVNAQVNVEVSPFARLLGGGQDFVRSFFTLRSGVSIYVPCEIRADILFGIASIAARLIPEAQFQLNTQVSTIDDRPEVRAFVSATIALYFEVKACLNFLIVSICFSPGRVRILPPRNLIEGAPRDSLVELAPCPPPPGGGGGAGLLPLPPGSGHGAGVARTSYLASTSTPATAASPDRSTVIDAWITDDGMAQLFLKVNGTRQMINGVDTLGIPSFNVVGKFRDPSVAFVANDQALIAWSRSFTEDAPNADTDTLAGMNHLAREDEILVTALAKDPVSSERWYVPSIYRVHDRTDEIPDRANWRADGKAALAGDPTHGEAFAVWVRYETPDFLIDDGTKTLPITRPDGTIETDTVVNRRPQIERTAIYFRRLGLAGVIGVPEKLSPEGPGINIAPAIAVSPTGNAAYCVWVHDSTPGHVNLIDSNRGRLLLYSVWTRASGAWSPPAAVYPLAELDRYYPALLEPKIILRDDARGLLAFTALGESAPERDSGLGGNRFVYAARLEGGVFQAPVLIHGKCLERPYGLMVYLETDRGLKRDRNGNIIRPAEYVLGYLGTDPSLGSEESSGDVLVAALGEGMAAWSAPVDLTPDQDIHSNIAVTVANGAVHSINLNGGPGSLALRALLGGGAGLEPEPSFEVIDSPLEPDPAVTGCVLSHQFAAPGALVRASVTVENLGLASTPVDEQGESALEVAAVLIRESGEETAVTAAPVEELQPGGLAAIELTVEMPHDPVRLRVEVQGSPLDRDPTNNAKECFFGAPSPRDVACEPVVLNNEEESSATRITWSNPALYDEILLYKDGGMFAATSGAATSFIDVYAGSGDHVYCVRGRIGVSTSSKAACTSVAPEVFRRGDVNESGGLEITDAIRTLGFLFLGGIEITCRDAADADDNGELQITDAVRTLNYLFLGGDPPPAPGPDRCGPDPDSIPDSLGGCAGECR
jgi:hypothetical protein